MTSLYLLLWIVGAIVLQLVIYLSIGFWRHWVNYLALRHTVSKIGLPVTAPLPVAEPEPTAAAWPGFRTFQVMHKVMEDGAKDICSFHLAPLEPLTLPPFLPGQFLTFRLEVPSLGGAGTEFITRCYSLSDAPQANSYRVSIKRAPSPAGSPHPPGRSSNYFHDQVQVGSLLQVRAPSGHFHIDHSDAPVVLIGGGIGVTPMLSMLNWVLMTQPEREVWLFYGARQSQELMTQPHLNALAALHANFHLHICLSQPGNDDELGQNFQHQGRINIDLLRHLLPLKPYHFYLCGPSPLLQSMVPALEDWGVPDARIHFEAFGPSSVKRKSVSAKPTVAANAANAAPADTALTVTFANSGQHFSWNAGIGNLLDFAESHGIAVDSGCRAGGCGSCQTSIVAGEVSYQQAPDYDPEPGTCLMCVCTPKTSVTLEL
ncbi:MAG: 2Fe-2S iron-sulfur cluster binding domain-containing protein [Comamonadaceae bacterium]|nr:2Fe-2S iron-sulfur cluster binding domain-containing protein [Comamonadaceae bacterium]